MIREPIHHPQSHLAAWQSSALLAFAASAVTAVIWLIGWLPPVERATGDLLVRVTGSGMGQRLPVTAVLIDDEAVANHGPLPWPRERLARLVSSIGANGARAMVLDLILSEPGDQRGDQVLAATPHVLATALDLDGRLSETDFHNRIVFVGIAVTGAGDQFIVPTGPRHAPVPGVLAHASAAVSILGGRLLRIPSAAFIAVAAFALAFGVKAIRDRHGAFVLGRFRVSRAGSS